MYGGLPFVVIVPFLTISAKDISFVYLGVGKGKAGVGSSAIFCIWLDI